MTLEETLKAWNEGRAVTACRLVMEASPESEKFQVQIYEVVFAILECITQDEKAMSIITQPPEKHWGDEANEYFVKELFPSNPKVDGLALRDDMLSPESWQACIGIAVKLARDWDAAIREIPPDSRIRISPRGIEGTLQ